MKIIEEGLPRALARWQQICSYSKRGRWRIANENRCSLVFSYRGGMCYYIDLSVFEAGSPGRALSQRAYVQRSAKEPVRRAARSRRSRLKTVYDELRLLSWNQRTRNREHPCAIQRAHAISARRRGLLVHHNWIRR